MSDDITQSTHPLLQRFYPGRRNTPPALALSLDPESLARRVLRKACSPVSPLAANLLLHHHVDGQLLSSHPNDVIPRLTATIEDPRVKYEVSECLHSMSRAIHGPVPRPPTPTRRIISVLDVVERLSRNLGDSSLDGKVVQRPPSPAESVSSWDLSSRLPTPPPEPASPNEAPKHLELGALGEPGSPCSPPPTPSGVGCLIAMGHPNEDASIIDSELWTPTSPIFLHVEASDEEQLSPTTPPPEPNETSYCILEADTSHHGAEEHPPGCKPVQVPTSDQPTQACVMGLTPDDFSFLMGLSDGNFVALFLALLNRRVRNDATVASEDGQAAGIPEERDVLLRLITLAQDGLASRRRDAGIQTDPEPEEVDTAHIPPLINMPMFEDRYPSFQRI